MRLPEEGSGRGANRAAAKHLAERAERADILAGVQVRSPLARSTANTCRSLVVVKNFYGEKVNITSERKAANECMHPVSLPRFAWPSQVNRSPLHEQCETDCGCETTSA
jgi:hypothetical protein